MIQKLKRAVMNRFKEELKSSEFGQLIQYEFHSQALYTNLYIQELMIADENRVNFYYEGIRRHIMPGDIVVDLGTGTGILSFFAAQQNPKMIYAIDYSDFISVAEQIAKHNKIENITFLKMNSREFNPDEKVDVILHEQMGHALLEENMVANILDLKKRLLNENGRILPGKFELFLEPVCLKNHYKIPYIWENEIHGIDFKFLKYMEAIDKYKPVGYSSPLIEHEAVDYFLCQPEPCLSFDLNKLNNENEIPRFVNTSKRVIRPGQMDGVCLFFRAAFDEEIILDTSPLHPHTHWMKPLFRTERKYYNIGDEILLKLTMDNLIKMSGMWSIEIINNEQNEDFYKD
jgi:protein arginine N-methyltransferase 1